MAWAVEEIEAAVTEVVEGWEATDHEGEGGLGDLADGTVFEVGVQHRGVLVGGIAWEVLLFEAGSDDEVGGRGESRHVADVVLDSCQQMSTLSGSMNTYPVMMTPDDCIDLGTPYTHCTLIQNIGNVFLNLHREQRLIARDPSRDHRS